MSSLLLLAPTLALPPPVEWEPPTPRSGPEERRCPPRPQEVRKQVRSRKENTTTTTDVTFQDLRTTDVSTGQEAPGNPIAGFGALAPVIQEAAVSALRRRAAMGGADVTREDLAMALQSTTQQTLQGADSIRQARKWGGGFYVQDTPGGALPDFARDDSLPRASITPQQLAAAAAVAPTITASPPPLPAKASPAMVAPVQQPIPVKRPPEAKRPPDCSAVTPGLAKSHSVPHLAVPGARAAAAQGVQQQMPAGGVPVGMDPGPLLSSLEYQADRRGGRAAAAGVGTRLAPPPKQAPLEPPREKAPPKKSAPPLPAAEPQPNAANQVLNPPQPKLQPAARRAQSRGAKHAHDSMAAASSTRDSWQEYTRTDGNRLDGAKAVDARGQEAPPVRTGTAGGAAEMEWGVITCWLCGKNVLHPKTMCPCHSGNMAVRGLRDTSVGIPIEPRHPSMAAPAHGNPWASAVNSDGIKALQAAAAAGHGASGWWVRWNSRQQAEMAPREVRNPTASGAWFSLTEVAYPSISKWQGPPVPTEQEAGGAAICTHVVARAVWDLLEERTNLHSGLPDRHPIHGLHQKANGGTAPMLPRTNIRLSGAGKRAYTDESAEHRWIRAAHMSELGWLGPPSGHFAAAAIQELADWIVADPGCLNDPAFEPIVSVLEFFGVTKRLINDRKEEAGRAGTAHLRPMSGAPDSGARGSAAGSSGNKMQGEQPARAAHTCRKSTMITRRSDSLSSDMAYSLSLSSTLEQVEAENIKTSTIVQPWSGGCGVGRSVAQATWYIHSDYLAP